MKKIEALIHEFQLDVVMDTLRKHGVDDVVASEVRGPAPSQTRSYRGAQYVVDHSPRIKLELVVHDECVMSTTTAISGALCMGRVDAARISVAPVERVVEIESGYEPKPKALRSRAPRYRPVWGLWGKRLQPARSAS